MDPLGKGADSFRGRIALPKFQSRKITMMKRTTSRKLSAVFPIK